MGKPPNQKIHLGVSFDGDGWHAADLVLAQRLQLRLSLRFGLAVVC